MRIFTATLSTETNTFSAIPTGWSCFEEAGIERGRTGVSRDGTGGMSFLWEHMAGADGHTVFHSVCATAAPAGRTVRSVYEALRDEILADARAEGPFDVVLLYLHGAMVADGYDDCEGDLLASVRAMVGSPAPAPCAVVPTSRAGGMRASTPPGRPGRSSRLATVPINPRRAAA